MYLLQASQLKAYRLSEWGKGIKRVYFDSVILSHLTSFHFQQKWCLNDRFLDISSNSLMQGILVSLQRYTSMQKLNPSSTLTQGVISMPAKLGQCGSRERENREEAGGRFWGGGWWDCGQVELVPDSSWSHECAPHLEVSQIQLWPLGQLFP